MYLELGRIPVRYIIMARRMNFLHYLLTLNNEELLSKFFMAQKEFPTKNDWVLTAIENLKHLEINLTFDEIRKKSKDQFKKEVKKHIKIASLKYLQNISEGHSKMDNLNYTELSMQKYFYDCSFNKIDSQLLFNYRTRMCNFTANFSNGLTDLTCKLCKEENTIDSETHSFKCDIIKIRLPELIDKRYKDIFEKDITKLKEATISLTKIIELRKELIN